MEPHGSATSVAAPATALGRSRAGEDGVRFEEPSKLHFADSDSPKTLKGSLKARPPSLDLAAGAAASGMSPSTSTKQLSFSPMGSYGESKASSSRSRAAAPALHMHTQMQQAQQSCLQKLKTSARAVQASIRTKNSPLAALKEDDDHGENDDDDDDDNDGRAGGVWLKDYTETQKLHLTETARQNFPGGTSGPIGARHSRTQDQPQFDFSATFAEEETSSRHHSGAEMISRRSVSTYQGSSASRSHLFTGRADLRTLQAGSGPFASCGERFLSCLMEGGTVASLKVGEVRSLVCTETLDPDRACHIAALVLRGNCRIEVHRTPILELSQGQWWGLASILSSVAGPSAPQKRTEAEAEMPRDILLKALPPTLQKPSSVSSTSFPQQPVSPSTRGSVAGGGGRPSLHYSVSQSSLYAGSEAEFPTVECRVLMLKATTIRHALEQFPQEQGNVREHLAFVKASCDGVQPILSALQCSEHAKAAVTHSCTRHWCAAGTTLCRQHTSNPDGLVLVRNGDVTLSINGVSVRRLTKGMTFGEDILLDVNSTFGFRAVCATDCDIQIVRRQLFLAAVQAMVSSTGGGGVSASSASASSLAVTPSNAGAEEREATRLLAIVQGRWKRDLALPSWSLFFGGYDLDFLAGLSEAMETRVVMPNTCVSGPKAGNGAACEVALYFLLHGICDEVTTISLISPAEAAAAAARRGVSKGSATTDGERVSTASIRKDAATSATAIAAAAAARTTSSCRTLLPGTCAGFEALLGLTREDRQCVVTARSLSLVSVLHRAVFLKQMALHPKLLKAGEVTKVLAAELDRTTTVDAKTKSKVTLRFASGQEPVEEVLETMQTQLGGLHLFKHSGSRFTDKLCERVERHFCMPEQWLCCPAANSTTMFVLARGTVRVEVAGCCVRTYAKNDVFNILALTESTFRPSCDLICQGACEVWVLDRSSLLSTIEEFPMERETLHFLLGNPLRYMTTVHGLRGSTDLNMASSFSSAASSASATAAAAAPEKEDDDAFREGLGSRSSNKSNNNNNSSSSSICSNVSNNSANAIDVPCDLANLEMFKDCSLEFLQWIQAHLECNVHFPGEVIISEGSTDPVMYIICRGLVVLMGSGTHQSEVKLTQGSVFGEKRLLEVVHAMHSTATAAEATLVQVLHRPVLDEALRLFPQEAAIIDNVTVSWLNTPQSRDISKVPLFVTCGKDFNSQVGHHLRTRLVRRGETIIRDGEAHEKLCILSAGVACAEDRGNSLGVDALTKKPNTGPDRYGARAVLNADIILGVSHRIGLKVEAERVCVVTEIPRLTFLSILQKHPKELPRLLHMVVGRLWPPDPESVPLFRGISPMFFSAMMEASDWALVLPEQAAFRQGTEGSQMLLLCHGTALKFADGVLVGRLLTTGDCVGEPNLLGLANKYRYSVWARTLCHFRSISADCLQRLLSEHKLEQERFTHLKKHVKDGLAKHEANLKKEVAQQKRRQRGDTAFRRHVAHNSQQFGTSEELPGDEAMFEEASLEHQQQQQQQLQQHQQPLQQQDKKKKTDDEEAEALATEQDRKMEAMIQQCSMKLQAIASNSSLPGGSTSAAAAAPTSSASARRKSSSGSNWCRRGSFKDRPLQAQAQTQVQAAAAAPTIEGVPLLGNNNENDNDNGNDDNSQVTEDHPTADASEGSHMSDMEIVYSVGSRRRSSAFDLSAFDVTAEMLLSGRLLESQGGGGGGDNDEQDADVVLSSRASVAGSGTAALEEFNQVGGGSQGAAAVAAAVAAATSTSSSRRGSGSLRPIPAARFHSYTSSNEATGKEAPGAASPVRRGSRAESDSHDCRDIEVVGAMSLPEKATAQAPKSPDDRQPGEETKKEQPSLPEPRPNPTSRPMTQEGRIAGSKHLRSARGSSNNSNSSNNNSSNSNNIKSNSNPLDAAIAGFASRRKEAILKAKVLRTMHAGMEIDSLPRIRLSTEDLAELARVLPPLPSSARLPAEQRQQQWRRQEKLLQNRFAELNGATPWMGRAPVP